MKVVNRAEGWIGYRSNILGIRVWENDCQLVAKIGGDKWETIGPRRTLLALVNDFPRVVRTRFDGRIALRCEHPLPTSSPELVSLL